VVDFIQRLRKEDIFKLPGAAETIDCDGADRIWTSTS
jgi:hypothetical protein